MINIKIPGLVVGGGGAVVGRIVVVGGRLSTGSSGVVEGATAAKTMGTNLQLYYRKYFNQFIKR